MKRTMVSFEEFRATRVASSLHHHMEISHGIIMKQTRRSDVRGGVPETYMVYLSHVLKSVVWLVDGCTVRAHNPGIIREHFMYIHQKSKVVILN